MKMFKFGTVQQKDLVLSIQKKKKNWKMEGVFAPCGHMISLSITTWFNYYRNRKSNQVRESGIINGWTRNQTQDPCDTRQVCYPDW